jgi:hypothetical protein
MYSFSIMFQSYRWLWACYMMHPRGFDSHSGYENSKPTPTATCVCIRVGVCVCTSTPWVLAVDSWCHCRSHLGHSLEAGSVHKHRYHGRYLPAAAYTWQRGESTREGARASGSGDRLLERCVWAAVLPGIDCVKGEEHAGCWRAHAHTRTQFDCFC